MKQQMTVAQFRNEQHKWGLAHIRDKAVSDVVLGGDGIYRAWFIGERSYQIVDEADLVSVDFRDPAYPAADQPTGDEVLSAISLAGALIINADGGATMTASGQQMVDDLLLTPSYQSYYDQIVQLGADPKIARLALLFACFATAMKLERNPGLSVVTLDYTHDERIKRLIQPAAS